MKKKVTLLFLLFAIITGSQHIYAGDFINFSEGLAPPANDECANAVSLTVNSDNLCTNTTSGTVSEATGSSQTVVCTNKENEANDDVWYKFVATAPSHKIELLNVSGSFTNMYHAIYEGGATGDCGALSLVLCSDPNSSIPTGLVPGNTYFIRVFTNSTGVHDTTFDICVSADPNVPDNDDCADATSIGGLPFSETLDASAATNNGGFVNVTSCGSMNDGVWYTLTGDGNQLTVTVVPTGWDVEIGVYTGSCGSFTCVGSANLGISNTAEAVTFSSTLGETYYINVGNQDDSTDVAEGIFNISVTSTVLSIDELLAQGFSYYPNPVRDNMLNLKANETIHSVVVYNYLGEQLRLFEPSNIKTEINLNGLVAGAYYIKVFVGENSGTFKVLKE